MNCILHLIPTLEGGGAERQLSMLAVEQSRRGMKVHVGIRRGGVHEDTLRSHEVTVHFLGNYKYLNPISLVMIHRLVGNVKPDIVQTWLPQMDVLGGIVALQSSIPWVVSERTTGYFYSGRSPLILGRKLLSKYAGAIVANSIGGVEYWRDTGLQERKIFRIANSIDCNAIRNTIENERESEKFCDEILIVGRLDPVKAVDVVLDAVNLLSLDLHFHVSIVGDGPMRESLLSYIGHAKIDDRVSLHPYESNWWSRLKSARMLISMSRYEGQPNVVLETMASGCPLIVSDIPAHRELLDENSAVFVPPDDAHSLADAITYLLADPCSAQERAQRARARVDLLTVNTAADAYESVYAKVLGDSFK